MCQGSKLKGLLLASFITKIRQDFTLHGLVLGHWVIMRAVPPIRKWLITTVYFRTIDTTPAAAARPPIPRTGMRLPRPPTVAAAVKKRSKSEVHQRA